MPSIAHVVIVSNCETLLYYPLRINTSQTMVGMRSGRSTDNMVPFTRKSKKPTKPCAESSLKRKDCEGETLSEKKKAKHGQAAPRSNAEKTQIDSAVSLSAVQASLACNAGAVDSITDEKDRTMENTTTNSNSVNLVAASTAKTTNVSNASCTSVNVLDSASL